MKIKSILVLFCLCYFMPSSNAQTGVTFGYKSMKARNWERVIFNSTLLPSVRKSPLQEGQNFGIDHKLKFKNRRIELLPTFSYSRYIRIWQDPTEEQLFVDLSVNFYSLSFNTNFYFLDFFGDTSSPTFSKHGPGFIKGIFLQVTPGISFLTTKVDGLEKDVFSKSNDISYFISMGIGYDIGVSKLVTITPFVNFAYQFQASWDDLNVSILSSEDTNNNTSDLTEIAIGLRLGLQWNDNYNKKRFKDE